MNVECPNCSAKYGVPDDKVRGKKVRITCKRCSSPIIIDGTKLAASAAVPQRKGTIVGGLQAPVIPAAAPPPKAEPWTVAISEADQREMETDQVVAAYVDGTIDAETFIWREGMDDWLGAFEIPEIASALKAKGLQPPGAGGGDGAAQEARIPASAPAPASGAWREPGKWDAPSAPSARSGSAESTPDAPPADMFDDVTVAMAAPKARALLEEVAKEEAAPTEEPEAPPPPIPEEAEEPPAPQSGNLFDDEDEATVVADSIRFQLPADKSDEPRGPTPAAGSKAEEEPPPASERAAIAEEAASPGFDLFGDVDRAGADSEPPPDRTSSGGDRPSASGASAEAQLTGARNESSVLFTLDALTKGPTKGKTKADDKVTADMLLAPSPSPQLSDDDAPPSIANLGAGMFNPSAVGAPDVTAQAPPSLPPPGSSQAMLDSLAAPPKGSGGKTAMLVILGLLLAGGVGGGMYYMGQQKAAQQQQQQYLNGPSAGATIAAPAPAPTAAPQPATAAATAEPAPSASASAAEVPAPTASATTTAGTPSPSPGAAAVAPSPSPSPGGAPAPSPRAAPKPAEPEKPKEEAKPAGGAPFDKGAASAALAAAATNAQASCPAPEGKPTSGRVSVTFVNSGRATRTVVTGGLSGTAAGGCVARIFRGASVPAFGGDAVRVTKSVSLK